MAPAADGMDTDFWDSRRSAGPAARAENAPERGLGVVIVEDSIIVRGRIIRLVSSVAGVRVLGAAADGTHALALIRELQPDVVLLDIQLPGLDGLELLRRVRAEGAICKVIVLTTYAFDEIRRKCFELRADYFFDKALEFARVVEVLGDLSLSKTMRCPNHESATDGKSE